MESERWSRLEHLYHSAMEQEEAERAAFLERSCADDPVLRREVESLLAYVRQTGKFIDQPALNFVVGMFAQPGHSPSADANQDSTLYQDNFDQNSIDQKMIGKRISQYRIVAKLGSGGMGDVFRAVRADDEYEKHVALKLVRSGYSNFFIQRFKTERQILASLDHENIARLYDGGTTDDGVPYLVMEFIEGEPITAYCDHHRLSTAERLKLFLQVCSAVQYAHQHLIIHRDIKPDNILVTADGVAKLMDFGIAKILDADASHQRNATVTSMRAFTPGYASPEQIKGEAITTASDVYSLGVVLYELLAGRSPYRTMNHSQHEMARAICEVEPEKPSTAAGHAEQKVTPESISAYRNTTPEKLQRTLAGDLDQILLKALRKEPQRRYTSVQDFAEDLQSYTRGLPVSARGDAFSYRSSKFIHRNKLSLAATAVFALVVVAGAVEIVREARIARMEQARAEQRFESLRKLTNSMLFEFHDSIEHLPGSTSARELVVQRALEYLEQIAAEAHDDPATLRDLAAAYERIGRIRAEENHPHLGGTGSGQQAQQLYEKALAIRQRLAAASPGDLSLQFDLLGTMRNLASIYTQLGDFDRALDVHQQRLKIAEGLAAVHDSEKLKDVTAAVLNNVGVVKASFGDYDSALDYQRRSLTMDQALLDANPSDRRMSERVANAHAWIASALRFEKKHAEAVSEDRKAVAIVEQLSTDEPNNTVFQTSVASYNEELCKCLAYAGLFPEARGRCQKAIAFNDAMMKSDKNNVQALADAASSAKTMGIVLYLMHSPRASMVFEQRAHSMFREVAVRDPDSTTNPLDHAVSLIYLGRSEADLKHPGEARKDLEQAQQMLEQLAKRSPRYRYVLDALDEALAALKALPQDTAPIAVH